MKKYQKKAVVIIITMILSLLSFMMTGCFKKDSNQRETEYFEYHVYVTGEEEWVEIDRLTEKGRQLKNIVIPEEIDGKIVKSVKGASETPNLKKIIVSYNVRRINSWGLTSGSFFAHGYQYGLKLLYVNCEHIDCANFGQGGYIATNAQEGYSRYLKAYRFANMQYLYNYSDSPNKDVFFIDDLNINEELEIIPENPKRDGFTFTGWYSESECLNKIELNGYAKTDEEIVYLYAGWEENK